MSIDSQSTAPVQFEGYLRIVYTDTMDPALHDDCTGVTDRLATDLAQVRAQLEYVNGELDRCIIERHEMSKELGALIRQCIPLGYESGQGITAVQFIFDHVIRLRTTLIQLQEDLFRWAASESTNDGALAGSVARRIKHELNTDIWHAPFNDEQISRISRYQASGKMHPYTCGISSSHTPLAAWSNGLGCIDCGSIQYWSHRHDVNGDLVP